MFKKGMLDLAEQACVGDVGTYFLVLGLAAPATAAPSAAPAASAAPTASTCAKTSAKASPTTGVVRHLL